MVTTDGFPDVVQAATHGHLAFCEINELRCRRERFHWNGSEIVVCSVGAATWSALEQSRVAFSFEGSEVEVLGTASADQVVGVAPEYREAAVRALGSDAGHAESDKLGDRIEMHRLFITPDVS